MINVKVRLHRPHVIENDKIKVHMLYETGNTNSEFLINGALKFEANKAGSFEFDILPAHPCYSLLRRYRQYVSVTINEDPDMWEEHEDAIIYLDDDDPISDGIVFYGRILSIAMSFNRVKHVVCEGLLANLIDAPMYNDMSNDIGTLADLEKDGFIEVVYEYPTDEPGTYRRKVIATDDESKELYRITGDANIMWMKAGDAYCNIMQRTDIHFREASISSDNMDDIDVYGGESVGDFITSELIGIYGGFIKTSYYVRNDLSITGSLSWVKDPSMDGFNEDENSQAIEFGENLLDLSAEFAEDSVSNGICVSWTTEDDKKKWRVVEKDSITVENKRIEVPSVYGSRDASVQVIEVPGISTRASAHSYATAYRKKFCTYSFVNEGFDSYTVKAIDRHFLDSETYETSIGLYDQVRLISSPHNVNKVFTCTSIEYTIDNPIVREYKLEVFRPKPSSNEKVLSKQLGKTIKYKETSSGTTSDAEIEEFFRD